MYRRGIVPDYPTVLGLRQCGRLGARRADSSEVECALAIHQALPGRSIERFHLRLVMA